MKTKNLIIAAVCCLFSLPLLSQDHGNRELTKALVALDGLIGEWEGEGYIINQQQERITFKQHEMIYYDLDSNIIMVEGKGMSGERIVHDARAIISPSDSANHFEFYSFLAGGRKGKFTMIKSENEINWYIDVPNGEIKYTITLKDDEYHEIGQFGSGGQWYPFMEMNLKRIGD
tara:strand:- start:2011 stop:2532 length:522 start_codon:yes stop_codon:yes gene_type:complete